MTSIKKICLLALLLIATISVQAQGASESQSRIQKPADIADRGINQFVGEVFSLYNLVFALQFDLQNMENEIAGMEIDAQLRNEGAVSNVKAKLETFEESFLFLQKGQKDLVSKVATVSAEGAKLHPSTLADQAAANLGVSKTALEQAAAKINTQIDRTKALRDRAAKL